MKQSALPLETPEDWIGQVDYPTTWSAPKGQVLKWIGNKQRFAASIISHFPLRYRTYFEPFFGSGAVLATMYPRKAEASDIFGPLVGIWKAVQLQPALAKHWYFERHQMTGLLGKEGAYSAILERYNTKPNPADLLFLSRACYGGVVRFRMKDGFMSTPCGPHTLMPPDKFDVRVDDWNERLSGTQIFERPFEEAISRAGEGDVVYCDPPYTHSQTILYGAQKFDLDRMFKSIEAAKRRGAFVAVSIDGSKKSGNQICDILIPRSLFAREAMLTVGRSMLRRFQMEGATLEKEVVRDRLLLTH